MNTSWHSVFKNQFFGSPIFLPLRCSRQWHNNSQWQRSPNKLCVHSSTITILSYNGWQKWPHLTSDHRIYVCNHDRRPTNRFLVEQYSLTQSIWNAWASWLLLSQHQQHYMTLYITFTLSFVCRSQKCTSVLSLERKPTSGNKQSCPVSHRKFCLFWYSKNSSSS